MAKCGSYMVDLVIGSPHKGSLLTVYTIVVPRERLDAQHYEIFFYYEFAASRLRYARAEDNDRMLGCVKPTWWN